LHSNRVNDARVKFENRRSNCNLRSAWDSAFASSRQTGLIWSGLTSSRFLFPLSAPDWQISRIRLSEEDSHGRRRKTRGTVC